MAASIAASGTNGEWEAEKRRFTSLGAWLLTENDPRYPACLKQLANAPVLLQVLGTLTESDQHAIGVVGSRHCTYYGTECAKRFGYQLAYAGLTVVSGLARGIDTAAHLGALAAKGRTIAVIGSGLGDLYPPENRAIAELLVVEAGIKSGALITANLALDNGRQVYAIPGPIDRSSSGGTNRLIQQGAKLVAGPEDILEDLQELFPVPRNGSRHDGLQSDRATSPQETLLLDALKSTERAVDELIQSTGLPAAQVGAALLSLELKHRVKALPGQWYRRL
jgi:DNA processing protein